MKTSGSLKRVLSLCLAAVLVLAVIPFTAHTADYIPSEFKNKVFDADYYARKYPSVVSQYGSSSDALYSHFLEYGIAEGKQGSPVFSASYYTEQNSEIKELFGTDYEAALLHYTETGYSAGKYATAPHFYIADQFEAVIQTTNSESCVSIPSSPKNATYHNYNVQTVTPNDSDTSQTWVFTYQNDGTYVITNKKISQGALDVDYADTADGTNVSTYTNTGVDDDHRRWYIFERSTGIFVLSPKHSSGTSVLTLNGATSVNTNVQISSYSNLSYQLFNIKLSLPSSIEPSVYDKEYYEAAQLDVMAAYGTDSAKYKNHFFSYGIYEGRQASPVFHSKEYINNTEDFAYGAKNYAGAVVHFVNSGYGADICKASAPSNFGESFTASVQSLSSGYYITQTSTGEIMQSSGGLSSQTWKFEKNADGSYSVTGEYNGGALYSKASWFIIERAPGEYVLTEAGGNTSTVLAVNGTSLTVAKYSAASTQLFDINVIDYKGIHNFDPNGDGIINGKDVVNVKKRVTDPEKYGYIAAADVNGDGVITDEDVELMVSLIGKTDAVWYETLTPTDTHSVPRASEELKEHVLLSYEEIPYETYRAVRAGFTSKGFEIYSEDVKGDLYCATFVDGDDFYHMYWSYNHRRLRIVEAIGDADSLPDKNPTVTSTGKQTTITQLSSTYLNGMGYIIQLCDGSFIVIDGGYSDEHTKVYNKLVSLNGSANNIVIRAWLLTHSHNDHYGCINSFANTYASKVRLETFMYCPDGGTATKNGWDNTVSSLDFYNNVKKFAGVKILTVHTGMDFAFGDIRFEILFSCDDMLIDCTPGDQNEMSVVSRAYSDTKNALILADSGSKTANLLEIYFGDYLKSDICQASHHGVEDFPLSTYNIIRAPIMFYPCSRDLYYLQSRFYEVRMAIKNSDYISEVLIHQNGDYTRALK